MNKYTYGDWSRDGDFSRRFFCNDCHAIRDIMKEICPKCLSKNIEILPSCDAIRHFTWKSLFIFEMSDFHTAKAVLKNNKLIIDEDSIYHDTSEGMF